MAIDYDKYELGDVVTDFKEHTHYVESGAFSPDGKWGISGGFDKTVKMFSLGDLIQLQDPNKHLFIKNNIVYKLVESNLESIEDLKEEDLTREVFEEFGARDLSPLLDNEDFYTKEFEILSMVDKDKEESILKISGNKNLFETFPSNEYEILSMSDKETDKTTMRLSGFKDLRTLKGCEQGSEILVSADPEREDVPIALPYGYTSPQLVLPTGDIRLDKVSEVKSITAKTIGETKGIRIVYSIDSGETWFTKVETTPNNRAIIPTNRVVDIENLEEIKEKGMTIEYFNSVNKEWTEEILRAGKIRFAYYLEIEDIDEVSKVDELGISMSMYGMWEALANDSDYEYEYTNEQINVRLFRDGTHKINYSK